VGRALYRVGHFCASHALPVLLAWIVIAFGVLLVLSAVGSATTNDLSLPGTESQAATDLLAAKFPPQQNGANPIVFHVKTGKLTDYNPIAGCGNFDNGQISLDSGASKTGCVTFQVPEGEAVVTVRYGNTGLPGHHGAVTRRLRAGGAQRLHGTHLTTQDELKPSPSGNACARPWAIRNEREM